MKVVKDIFLKLMFNILKVYIIFAMSNLILPKKMKIEKVEKLVAKLHDNGKYFIHVRTLKQALNHGLVLKKVHRMINFKQNTWLKPYIAMNIGLRKKAKSDIEKDFF